MIGVGAVWTLAIKHGGTFTPRELAKSFVGGPLNDREWQVRIILEGLAAEDWVVRVGLHGYAHWKTATPTVPATSLSPEQRKQQDLDTRGAAIGVSLCPLSVAKTSKPANNTDIGTAVAHKADIRRRV